MSHPPRLNSVKRKNNMSIDEKVIQVAERLSEPDGQCARYVIVRWALSKDKLQFYYDENHFYYSLEDWYSVIDVKTGKCKPTHITALLVDAESAMRVVLSFAGALSPEECELLYKALKGESYE